MPLNLRVEVYLFRAALDRQNNRTYAMDASPKKLVGIDSNQKTGRMSDNLSGLEF
jgi:hypothetical protein